VERRRWEEKMALEEIPGISDGEIAISEIDNSGIEIVSCNPVIEERYEEMMRQVEGRKGFFYKAVDYIKRLIT
jgi:hypothetical protein